MVIDDIINMSALNRISDLESIVASSNTVMGWQRINATTIKPLLELNVASNEILDHIHSLAQHRNRIRNSYNRNYGMIDRFYSKINRIRPSANVTGFDEDFI